MLKDVSGNTFNVTSKNTDKAVRLEPGTYTVELHKSVDKDSDEAITFTGDQTIHVKAGDRIVYSVAIGGITGKATVSVDTKEIDDREANVSIRNAAFVTENLKTDAIYHIGIDGKTAYTLYTDSDHCVKAGSKIYGRYDTKATEYAYKRQPMLLTSDSKFIDKFTINGCDYPVATKVDTNGNIIIKRIVPGEYGFGETDVPVIDDKTKTYLVNTNVFYFKSDDVTGRLSDKELLDTNAENDYTQLYVSKTDMTGGPEIPGASLIVKDTNGNTMDSWISTDKPHLIEMLPPGKYTLTERITPNNYDQAERIEFEVSDIGEIQKCEMKDKPIEIKASIDKRQEIANPVAEGVEANGDGENKAQTQTSNLGIFEYSLDYRNDSNTWVDEFTIYDSLDGVNAGIVKFDGLSTAQGYKDFDGRLNVWYQTNKTPADYTDDKDKANATLDDGHTNSWITSETRGDAAKQNDPDGDWRVLDYTGWRLWRKDISAVASTGLDVSELNLSDGEKVTAIRLEYGRVEANFTTRTSAWDRENLKDVHDDIDNVEYVHGETFKSDNALDAAKANVSTLIKVFDGLNSETSDSEVDDKVESKADNKDVKTPFSVTEKENYAINDAIERITEGENVSSADEIRNAIDSISSIAYEKIDNLFDKSGISSSKQLKEAVDSFTDMYSRVENAVPSEISSEVDKAIEKSNEAIDSGDTELIEEARKAVVSAGTSTIDSLSASAATSDEIHYAPTVVKMRGNNAYRNMSTLQNTAQVDAYRNGGGEGLEGHDDDTVVQKLSSDSDVNSDLVQTGIDNLPYIVAIGLAIGLVAFVRKAHSIK